MPYPHFPPPRLWIEHISEFTIPNLEMLPAIKMLQNCVCLTDAIPNIQFLSAICILHICHNHHNRWLCKKNQSSVKFSHGYVKETALIIHTMCSFTKKSVSFTQILKYVILHTECNFTQCVLLHSV